MKEIVKIDGKLLKKVLANKDTPCDGCYFCDKKCYLIDINCNNYIFKELDRYEELFYEENDENVEM